ncbi:neuropeptide SIFamide receptor-like [Stegodyphus dumicola]|uniref:neuropeptide SIFamide receptor-like n=1 Tax=Stegodyphus dumicola TaxID=202533 RepID=UPI0015AFEDC2|nr:neuropeptide SIFamide receptor-like [Stegodyphus dumicola]
MPVQETLGKDNYLFINATSHFILNVNPGNYFRHSNFISAVFVAAYVFIFVLGFVGNVFVVGVVLRIRQMRTVTNYFIVNLAIADMLVILFCIPATLTSNLVTPWILGLFLCKAVAYLQGVSVCASVNTLVSISVDRFLAICFPMRCQITSRGCRVIITAIWLFSFTITLPWTVYFKLLLIGRTEDNDQLYVCREIWPTERMGVIYFIVANLVLCYLFPLTIILLCYIFIWRTVWRRQMPGEGVHNNGMIHRSKIKVIKMLFIVVLVFMGSWLPLYAIFTRIKVGEPYQENSMEEFIIQVSSPIAQWLGASNSCMNPVLYAFFNNKFRAGFRTVLFPRKPCFENAGNIRMFSLRNQTVGTSARTRRASSLQKDNGKTNAI